MAPVQDLPNELLGNILSQLTVPDVANAQRVCRRWQSLCSGSAVSLERRQVTDLYNLVVSADRPYRAIRRRVAPFLNVAFDRQAYLSRLKTSIPTAFSIWLLEYPEELLIGWHWPGLERERSKTLYHQLGIDPMEAVTFAHHMKPGYSLLSECIVRELKFPLQPHDHPALTMNRAKRQALGWAEPQEGVIKTKALQVWVNWATGGQPEVTWVLLSGAGPYNGSVWWTQPDPRFVVKAVTDIGRISKLSWDRKLADSWIEYLMQEWRSLRFRYDCLQ